MNEVWTSIVLIPFLALLAPMATRALGPIVLVPVVVFEIILGIIAGPSLLGWVQPTQFTDTLGELGLAMLFFVAGNEIDFRAIRGRPLARASLGWVISLVAAMGVALLLAPTVPSAVVLGIALCSTALGTLLPILRDAKELKTPFGIAATAIGAAGEFGPLLAISLFLSGRNLGPSAFILVAFILISVAAMFMASRRTHIRLHTHIAETLHSSGQVAVRAIIVVLAGLVTLSLVFGLDMLLGAFAAGVLWQVLMAGAPEEDRRLIDAKTEGIAFGFLIPIFFINTGVEFDLDALISDPAVLALVPVFFVLFLLVRGLPALLAAPANSPTGDKVALVLLGATGLPVIVAVTTIGLAEEILATGTAAALVGAGMLSVLLFPLIGLGFHRRAGDSTRAAAGPPETTEQGKQ